MLLEVVNNQDYHAPLLDAIQDEPVSDSSSLVLDRGRESNSCACCMNGAMSRQDSSRNIFCDGCVSKRLQSR